MTLYSESAGDQLFLRSYKCEREVDFSMCKRVTHVKT